MGQKSPSESIAGILLAFTRERVWKQTELAAEVGIKVPGLRKLLDSLTERGFPLEREAEHPHVYWSVPKGWFPGGVAFAGEDATRLLRLLARLPRSKDRDRLMQLAVQSLGARSDTTLDVVRPRDPTPPEAEHLGTVEDSGARRVALHCRYFSARGSESWRHLSVARVFPDPPARFVALCHKDDRLKWFRIDNVLDAKLDDSVAFRAAEKAAVDTYVNESLDGFHEDGSASRHAFFVRHPEARWVAKNLLEGMRYEEGAGGIRVVVETTGLHRLARYVVGLGGAATAETPELREAVVALAKGAMAASER